jgi:hypothetical protein
MRRLASLLSLLPAVLLLAACGGSSATSSTTATSGDLPHDPFGQLRFVLGKFPYEAWYTDCIVEQVEAKLSADELEELAELPEEQGRKVALRFALGAAPRGAASRSAPTPPTSRCSCCGSATPRPWKRSVGVRD